MKSNAPSFSARTAVSTLPCAVITATGVCGLSRLDPLDEVQAVAVRQPHVGEAQVEGAGAQLARGRADGVGRGHVEVHALERDAEQLADVGLVVDDERARFGHKDLRQRCGSANTTRNTLPPPLRGS